MKTVGEFCNRNVVTVLGDDTLLEAARRMRSDHVGCVVLVEPSAGKTIPIGLVTDRDIVVSVLATASPYLEQIHVADIVISALVAAEEDENLSDALKRMRNHGVRRMPVVDREGALVGIFSIDDVIEHLAEEMSDLAALVQIEQRRERQQRG